MAPKTIKTKELICIYKPLLILMVLFGFNYGITKRVITKFCLKFYSFFLIIIITYANITCCDTQEISIIWPLLEYVVFIFIMLIYDSKICQYLQKSLIVDTYLRVNFKYYYRMRNKVLFSIAMIWVIRVAYTWTYCSFFVCYNSLILFLIYELSLATLDLNRVWRYYLFEDIWYRLKLLRRRLEENQDSNFYLYVKDYKSVREDKIRFCLFLYRSIGELLDLIAPELNASFFISVLCSLPKLILNVYHILLVIDKQMPHATLGYMLMNLGQISLFIFTPCIVVEMYTTEVEKIRIILMHQLIQEKDPTNKEDIQLFLQYTQLRSFKYKVWRIIPLDLSLPLTLINLCTTYVIVVVNFTQVFA